MSFVPRDATHLSSATITTGASGPHTWAEIVKGRATGGSSLQIDTSNCAPGGAPSSSLMLDRSETKVSRRPGGRGCRSCLCFGDVLSVLGSYGWIMASEAVDHPDAAKNGGRIYVHGRDVPGGICYLKAGDRVRFYLYWDEQGLGAESCMVAANTPANNMYACASEFVPARHGSVSEVLPSSPIPDVAMRPESQHFVPPHALTGESAMSCMNPGASVFVPRPTTPSNVPAPPAGCFAFNSSMFLDDSDDDEEQETGGTADFHVSPDASSSDIDAGVSTEISTLKPSLDSPHEGSWRIRNMAASTKVHAEVGSDIRWDVVLAAMAEMKGAALRDRVSASDGSTCASDANDSDAGSSDAESQTRRLRSPPGLLGLAAFSPPPGL